MKKFLILLMCVVFASWSVTAQKSNQTKTKKGTTSEQKQSPENTDIPKKIQENPDSLLARLSRKQAEITELTRNMAFLQNKVTSMENELKDCNKKLSADCPPCASQGAIPTTGSIYKIQLGICNNPDISDNFAAQKFLGIEKSDDKFRFMLSYFEDYEECMRFITELKKIGVEGALAVRYKDGKRVVYDEAPDTKPTPAAVPAVTPKPVPAVKPSTKPAVKPKSKSTTKSVPKKPQ